MNLLQIVINHFNYPVRIITMVIINKQTFLWYSYKKAFSQDFLSKNYSKNRKPANIAVVRVENQVDR